jgi:hypothetical protein
MAGGVAEAVAEGDQENRPADLAQTQDGLGPRVALVGSEGMEYWKNSKE